MCFFTTTTRLATGISKDEGIKYYIGDSIIEPSKDEIDEIIAQCTNTAFCGIDIYCKMRYTKFAM